MSWPSFEQPAQGCSSLKLNVGSISATPQGEERRLISRPAAGNYPAKTAVSPRSSPLEPFRQFSPATELEITK